MYSPPEVCRFRDELIGAGLTLSLGLVRLLSIGWLVMSRLRRSWTEQFDFDIPPLRVYQPNLPVGLSPVLRRASSINVGHRHSTTGEFLNQLENTVVGRPFDPWTRFRSTLVGKRSSAEPSLPSGRSIKIVSLCFAKELSIARSGS